MGSSWFAAKTHSEVSNSSSKKPQSQAISPALLGIVVLTHCGPNGR
jgi:hypothetical protein